MIWQTRY